MRIKDREQGHFTVGAEVPVLSSVTVASNGLVTQSIDYINSGVILNIEPTIRENDIELKIDQQLSNFTRTTTGVNSSPTKLKREIQTTVIAQHDELIMLGGLQQQENTQSKSGFPWLPDFLKTRSKDSNSSDILLVLHVQRI